MHVALNITNECLNTPISIVKGLIGHQLQSLLTYNAQSQFATYPSIHQILWSYILIRLLLPLSFILYFSNFALLYSSLLISSSAESLDLSSFWLKMTKNRNFKYFLVHEIFFRKRYIIFTNL